MPCRGLLGFNYLSLNAVRREARGLPRIGEVQRQFSFCLLSRSMRGRERQLGRKRVFRPVATALAARLRVLIASLVLALMNIRGAGLARALA